MKKSSKFSKTAPSAPFLVLCARKYENPAIGPPLRVEILQSIPPSGVQNPLYLVLGRQKKLGRGLMHPWSQPQTKKMRKGNTFKEQNLYHLRNIQFLNPLFGIFPDVSSFYHNVREFYMREMLTTMNDLQLIEMRLSIKYIHEKI